MLVSPKCNRFQTLKIKSNESPLFKMSFALSMMFSGYVLKELVVGSVCWPTAWSSGTALIACSLAFSAFVIASLT
jgi:hypothetical protein